MRISIASLTEYSAPGHRRQPVITAEMSDDPSQDGWLTSAGAYFGALGKEATGPATWLLLFIAHDDPPADVTSQPVSVHELVSAVDGNGTD